MKTRHVLAAACAAAIALGAVAADAQTPAAPIDDLIREAAARFARAQAAEQPAAPTAQAAPPPARPLRLQDAITLALDRSLDIAVQRLDPAIADYSVAAVRAAYRPIVTSLIGDEHTAELPSTLLTGGQQVTSHMTTFNGELTQALPAGGGNVAVIWNNNRVFSNSFFNNYNPAFNTTLTAQYTQPLMRGLRIDAARQELAAAKANRTIADLQVRNITANTVAAVQDAYWDLVFAVESIDVAQTSLTLAAQLVQEDEHRVQAGVMTRLDLLTATSQEANDRHALVVAQGVRRTAELALKRLLVNGPDDELWTQAIDPVDRPDDSQKPLDLTGALHRALGERSDLVVAKQQATVNDTAVTYLRDQTRPQVDLVAGYTMAGIDGRQLLRATTGNFADIFTAPVIGVTSGSYGGALSRAFGQNYPVWGIALNVTYPIGFSAARASAARAAVQAKQATTQVRRIEVQVVTEVTDAAIAATNAFDEIASAAQARDLSAQRLDAEQKKMGVGLSTNYLVVQAQRDLSDARNAVFRAEIAYQKALVDFDRAQKAALQSALVNAVPTGVPAPAVGSGRPVLPAPAAGFQ